MKEDYDALQKKKKEDHKLSAFQCIINVSVVFMGFDKSRKIILKTQAIGGSL